MRNEDTDSLSSFAAAAESAWSLFLLDCFVESDGWGEGLCEGELLFLSICGERCCCIGGREVFISAASLLMAEGPPPKV